MGDIKIGDGSEEGLYLLDYHVHTKRCGHASGEDREYVEAAIEKGLKELGFADHIPRFYYPENAKVTERGMSPADLEEYVGAVQDLKAAYPEIRIKLGLEVDFVPGWEEQALKLLEPYPWDYLLGSVHFISEWNYGYIGYEKEHTPREIFTAYFDKVAAMAVSGCFDILAHIDTLRLRKQFRSRIAHGRSDPSNALLIARWILRQKMKACHTIMIQWIANVRHGIPDGLQQARRPFTIARSLHGLRAPSSVRTMKLRPCISPEPRAL